ncbi:MAG: hypothetical protein CMJ48_05135 [Planctomycetaceae bacterium]|nr:hypothetical protein [Planctomycetaceae bacterium]
MSDSLAALAGNRYSQIGQVCGRIILGSAKLGGNAAIVGAGGSNAYAAARLRACIRQIPATASRWKG